MLQPVFLIGGGEATELFPEVLGPFVRAASVRGDAQIAVLLVAEHEEDYSFYAEALQASGLPVSSFPVIISKERPLKAEELAQATGLFVGGGVTPHYQDLCCAGETLGVIQQAARQMPYLGFSAGAAIGPERALVGGWAIEREGKQVQVCFPGAGEGLKQLEARPGLGLIPFSVDVHASQWGTTNRMIHAVDTGLVTEGWAIDENTCVEVFRGGARVYGGGSVYRLRREAGALRLEVLAAGAVVKV